MIVNSMVTGFQAAVGSLKALLISVIGEYTPIVVSWSMSVPDRGTSYQSVTAPDIPFILSFVLLALGFWAFFRVIGGMLCRK